MFRKKIKKNTQQSDFFLDAVSRHENDQKMMAYHLELTRGQPYPLYLYDKNMPIFSLKKFSSR